MQSRLLVLALLALGHGCASEEPLVDSGRTRDAGRDAAAMTSDGAAVGMDAGPVDPSRVASITIDPADHTVQLGDGQTTVAFHARGRGVGGEAFANVLARWSLDSESLGRIDANTGVFTTSLAGGTVTVRASVLGNDGVRATTSLTVRASTVHRGDGVTDADVMRFATAMPVASPMATIPTIDYPLAEAVMPRNVRPPLVMWTARNPMSAPVELVRVRLERPGAIVTGYFRVDARFGHSFRVPDEAWRGLASSSITEPIRVTVTTLASDGTREAQSTFRTVDAIAAGQVYYWTPTTGRVQRLDVSEGASVDFLPTPEGGATCHGCHAVSRDGRRFVVGLNDNLTQMPRPGSVRLYDLTRDLSGPATPALATLRLNDAPDNINWPTFSPDGSRVLFGRGTHPPGPGQFVLWDPASSRVVTPSGSPGNGYAPEWSPDNSAIVYTSPMDDLMLTPVTGRDSFGAARMLYDAPGLIFRPTWSPDSRRIAFQAGGERSSSGAAAIYLIGRDGGAATRLNALNGGPTAIGNYMPAFAPFRSGEYFWLMFTSGRAYGNATAGLRGGKRIWISAIRVGATSGDPSSAPYYLDGQVTADARGGAVTNLSPYWAPRACRPVMGECARDEDCCTGTCATDPTNPSRRACAPALECRPRGATCSSSGDCCGGIPCNSAGVCDLPLPG